MGRDQSLEEDIARVGREIAALQDLAGVKGIQRYWDRFVEGLHLYILVEKPFGQPLDQWLLNEQPIQARRISVLMQLAEVLCALGAEGIVHRAIRPFNIRIDARDRLTLINFDLCQIAFSATVDARSRKRLDAAYLSREAMTPGAKLTAADDSYSFGLISALVLCGKVPFASPAEQIRFVRKRANWERFGAENGLSEQRLRGIEALVEIDPGRRPVGPHLLTLVGDWAGPAS